MGIIHIYIYVYIYIYYDIMGYNGFVFVLVYLLNHIYIYIIVYLLIML